MNKYKVGDRIEGFRFTYKVDTTRTWKEGVVTRVDTSGSLSPLYRVEWADGTRLTWMREHRMRPLGSRTIAPGGEAIDEAYSKYTVEPTAPPKPKKVLHDNCPKCGDRGEWRMMALVCTKGHGVFAG